MDILRRDEQPEKAFEPIEVTALGILMPVRAAHPWNAFDSIFVIPSGRVISESILQPENVPLFIKLTALGISMLLKDSQFPNA